MISLRSRATISALASLVLVFSLSACSASPGPAASEGSSGGSSPAVAGGDSEAVWMAKFQSCMETAGYNVAGKGTRVDDSKFDPDAFMAAQKECTAKSGPSPIKEDPNRDDKMRAVYLKFSKCMRDAGYDFADPIFQTASDGSIVGVKMPDNSKYPVDAWDACNKVVGFTAAG